MTTTLGRLLAVLQLGAAATACAGAAATPATPPIVFSADRAPALTGEVYRLDADGTAVDLSRSAFEDTVPVVSPDGQRVAFVSDRSGTGAIYVAGMDGSSPQRLESPAIDLRD